MGKREKKIIGIIFAVFFFIGMIAVQGYGIGTDENTEIDIARMDMKEYVRLFMGEDSNLFQFMDGKIGDLMDSVEIDHGEALLYPVAFVVSVLREMGRADLGMLVYHMYLYSWFLIGILALYGVGKILTGKKRWGICAALFVLLNPLFFGNSFINNKDVIMMSLVSICLYTGIQFVQKKSWKWSVLWGICIAFCANMRVIGFAYAGAFGLLYLLEFVSCKKKDKKVFGNGVLAIGVILLTFIAITPATWYSVWGYFRYTLANSAGFSRWNQWVLYCGEFYNYLERPLPWHYFFVWIGITTPIIILMSIILGQIYVVCFLIFRREKDRIKRKYLIICFAVVWIFMLYFVLCGANVYGKWRHFYFIYPELVIMAVCALQYICGMHKKAELVVYVLLGFQGISCVFLLIFGHPFQGHYFNVLAGHPVAERFDYAGTEEYKEALEVILKMDTNDDICISSDNLVCYYGIKQAWEILSPEKKARIRIAEPETEECENADYHIYGESTLRKTNQMIENAIEEGDVYAPEKKFDMQIGLNAYGNRIITIYYNSKN